jgi:hypothetical protein
MLKKFNTILLSLSALEMFLNLLMHFFHIMNAKLFEVLNWSLRC